MIYMTDLHCHMLPHVDDGAYDTAEMKKMIELAYSDGIRTICFTPHFKLNEFRDESDIEGYNQHIEKMFALANDHVASAYPDMKLSPINMPMLSDGDGEWADSEYDMSYTKRIFPHKHKGEGHFIALFEKDGIFEKSETKQKTKEDADILLFRDFEKKFLNTHMEGKFIKFGENLYLMPIDIDINKLKVERAGLLLGKCKKGRFEPAHALALALNTDEIKNTFEAEHISRYIKGETLTSDIAGWCVVTYKGVNIGWAKGSGGILKNHFPKYMRLY